MEPVKTKVKNTVNELRNGVKAVQEEVKSAITKVSTFVKENKEAIIIEAIAVGSIAAGIALTATGNVALGGALLWSGINLAVTEIMDFAEDGQYNKSIKEYVYAYGSGFVGGAMMGALSSAGLATTALQKAGAGAVSVMAGDMLGHAASTGQIDHAQTSIAGVSAFGTSLAVSGIGKAASAVWNKVAPKVSDAVNKLGSKVSGIWADETGGMSLSGGTEGGSSTPKVLGGRF